MFCSNDNIYKIHILDYQFWIPNTCNHNAQRRTMQQVIIASICTQSMGKEGEKKGGQGRQADKQRWIGVRTLFAHVKQGKRKR